MASAPPPPNDAPNAYDEAERGTQEVHSRSTTPTTVAAPGSISEKMVGGKEANPSSFVSSEVVPVGNASTPGPPANKKVSRWILWRLWFNTYRYASTVSASRVTDSTFLLTRKLFTFVVTLNIVGLVLAASGHFPYALKRTGAMALGNLYFAILMRNELFGRFLYLFVNTCFAKVPISGF